MGGINLCVLIYSSYRIAIINQTLTTLPLSIMLLLIHYQPIGVTEASQRGVVYLTIAISRYLFQVNLSLIQNFIHQQLNFLLINKILRLLNSNCFHNFVLSPDQINNGFIMNKLLLLLKKKYINLFTIIKFEIFFKSF